ncbi:MAG: hypothetical protein ACFFBK_02105, partial [Promethearchaeota archaeon]
KTPYIVFACTKCKQYIYVKTTQTAKKCLRCGRSHRVSDIEHSGEIVNGMTAALKIVKKKQNHFALNEKGQTPEFRTHSDFQVVKKPMKKKIITNKGDDDYDIKFQDMLTELTDIYTTFPLYIIEIWADKYSIPKAELKILRRRFQKQGRLIQINNSTYKYFNKIKK